MSIPAVRVPAGLMTGGHMILALSRGEPHQVQPAGGDEMADVRGERRRHRRHQRRGSEPGAPVPDEERGDPRAVLQPRLIQAEVHPVDRLDLEQHVVSQHIGGTTR
jgi:hypothetical protein